MPDRAGPAWPKADRAGRSSRGFLRAVQFDDRIDRNSARETEGDDAPGRGSGKQIYVFYNARVKGLQKLRRDHAPNAAAVARQNSVRGVGHVSISSSGLPRSRKAER